MPLLSKNRTVLPVCLMLGALLFAVPALTDPPAVPASNGAHWQKLVLMHAIPSEILKALPWSQGTNLPVGVTRVYGLAGDNSLFIEATPDGFNRLRDIVKSLDVAARQVQVKLTLARVTIADLKASGVTLDSFPSPDASGAIMGDATGPDVARFARTLHQQGADLLQSLQISTTNNVEASMGLSGQPIIILPEIESIDFGVTPRINSDGSISLVLSPKATWRVAGKTNPDGTPVTETQDFQTLRTVANGDTLIITNLFPGAAEADGSQLVLFVTPRVVSGDSSLGSATVQHGTQ
jgi:type II secretory pathway component GspD/PulD (secretin)